jgi:signal transduction histidine kinase
MLTDNLQESDLRQIVKKQEAILTVISSVQEAITANMAMQDIYDMVGNHIRDLFDTNIAMICTFDYENETEQFQYIVENGKRLYPEPRPLDKVRQQIISTQKLINIEENVTGVLKTITGENPKVDAGASLPKSMLFVPLIAGDTVLGYVNLQNLDHEHAFSDSDVKFLDTLAKSMSIAIQNAGTPQKLQKARTDLRAAQKQLVQQEKLASLGRLTAGIAHEIKNPLNFVNNFSDLSIELIDEVREELSASEPKISEALEILQDIEANLKKIFEHGTRADSIVRSMLQHSRGGSGDMEPVEINQLLKEYANLAFHGMRANKNPINVDIELDLDENAGKIPLVIEEFSRVILNLCNNAFDAMRDKLTTLKAQPSLNDGKEYKPKLTIRSKRSDKHLSIEIEDNGTGIPAEIKNKVLQPFFTTKKGKEGTGLGLSITNDIVKAHGGTLRVESEENGFTKFVIHLNEI